VGFEPTIRFLAVYALSRRAPSTTRPSLRNAPGTARNLANGGAQRNTRCWPGRAPAGLARRLKTVDFPQIAPSPGPTRLVPNRPVHAILPAMSPLRIAGFALVAVACLFAFASVYYAMIGVGGGLSLYDVWYKFLPASVNWLQRYLWTSLWNGLYIILVQPAWVVVGIIGLLCIGLGKKHVE
jgi:hypothetical protein